MKLPNLSEWALRHQQFVGFLIAVAVVMGAMSYLNLGRKEDPEFAVKSMLISVGWPGAPFTKLLLFDASTFLWPPSSCWRG